jgi:iron complex outermembrane receptor protein
MKTRQTRRSRAHWLVSGGSSLALTASLLAGAAMAQSNDQTAVEEIVVTGSSIRGVAPVGSNLVSVGRAEIEATGAQSMQQILKTVPSLSNNMANAQGQMAGSSYYNPTIHSLGSSASNSTLVLIDGHRMSLGGTGHPQADPSIIPPIAIERVEVLADGASSVYGSDAVAGVINFITRKNFDGIQLTAQHGFGDKYDTTSVGALWGNRWETGSAMLAYGYSFRSNLPADARDFTFPDQRPNGGSNFLSFSCSPATIQPAGSSNIYYSPTSAANVPNATVNAACDNRKYSDALPEETRHTVMVRLNQQFGDSLTIGVDGVLSDRKNKSRAARGAVQATVFSTGAQANPFFINPPGVTATSQTVRFQADELLGPGAQSTDAAENRYVNLTADYRFADDWRLTFLGLAGKDISKSVDNATVCASCANLALNGTTNAAGSLTTISVPGTTTIVTRLPLTAANALDVWNAGSANRTSQAVRDRLVNNRSVTDAVNTIKQARLGVDGSLFDMPAGKVRLAAGVEVVKYTLEQDVYLPNNTGPVSEGSFLQNYQYDRLVKSAYAETIVPLVSESMAVPLVRSMDLNMAVRYDKYAVFGGTTNPRIALNWEVIEGLRLRGNWSKSFVAPALTSFGDENENYAGAGYMTYSGLISVPVDRYPQVKLLPGCAAATTTCQIGTSALQGINIRGGNRSNVPQTGKSWSLGFDFAPTFLPGFRSQVTYFNNEFKGGITSPNANFAVNAAALNGLLHLYPTGATAADILAQTRGTPQTGNLPGTTYFIYDFRQRNAVNLDIGGFDASAEYRLLTDAGTFTVGVNTTYFTKFDQQVGDGSPIFSVLNVSGYNQTFASIKLQGRVNVGYEVGPFSADIYMNFVGRYKNWGANTVAPITLDAIGLPTGGGDTVKANRIFDLNLAYKLPEVWASETQVFLDVTNVFDKDPPFYNSANGYDPYAGSVIGRVVTVGVRAKF